MPRTRRILADGGVFHVLNHGHNDGKLFVEPGDFIAFREIILKSKKRFSFELYHYCLMSTHFHLLLKILKGLELPALMKFLCQAYAHYYKKNYPLRGYLFQNRYKSLLIARDEYLMECARYIERNPVRAKLVKDPGDYEWSSFNFYANGQFDPIITEDPLYLQFGNTPAERMERYRQYVCVPRPYEGMIEGILDTTIAGLK